MKYIDSDGDTWEDDAEHGIVVCTDSRTPSFVGYRSRRANADEDYGPLRPVGTPYAPDFVRSTIRAEVASILQELANEAYDDYRWSDGVEATAAYKLYERFDAKAKALREETS